MEGISPGGKYIGLVPETASAYVFIVSMSHFCLSGSLLRDGGADRATVLEAVVGALSTLPDLRLRGSKGPMNSSASHLMGGWARQMKNVADSTKTCIHLATNSMWNIDSLTWRSRV